MCLEQVVASAHLESCVLDECVILLFQKEYAGLRVNDDLDDEGSKLFTSEYASNASLLNRMSPCEDDMLADGSSCVIIDGTLLANVDGTLVANVDVTLMLPDVNGTLVADIS